VAAGAAALAGWGTVVAIGQAFGATPAVAGSLVQGMLGGAAVAVVYAAVAFGLDSRDVRPLAETLVRRVRRRRGVEAS